MSWTYATLGQAIQDYCETDETDFVNNIPVFVKQAEDRILNAVQLPNFRKAQEGSLTVDNSYLTVPADYLTPYSLAVDNTGYEYLLLKDVNLIREMYPAKTGTGTPKYYGVFNDTTLIVGPTPDASYDVELHYFYRPETIVTASTTWLGDNAVSALLYGCLIEAYTFQKGDRDVMEMYIGRYKESLDELKDLAEGYTQTDNYRGGAVRTKRG